MHEQPNPENMPLLMLVNEVSKLFHDRMRVEGEKVGMQSGYRHILFHLVREDGITQLDLGRRVHLKPSTVSVSLQKMEQDGLVRRHTDSGDMRQTRVFLTDRGRKLDEAVRGKLHETDAIFLEGLTEAEQAEVKEVLIKIRNNALCDPFKERKVQAENEAD